MATLNVGTGQVYATLSATVAASHDDEVIAAHAGTYVNNFATISKDIAIVGIDTSAAGNSAAAQSGAAQSGGTATVAIVSAAANSTINLQKAVVANG